MKKNALLSLLAILGLVLFSGCVATMHTWPDQERSAENKINVIQEKIGDGLKTGALTTDQSQAFLTTLKGIQTDYAALRNKSVARGNWDSLQTRLDLLGTEIDRTLATRSEDPRSGDRIITLQKRIDEGRSSGRVPLTENREFQLRLDAIRSDYLRMTDGGRSLTNEERADFSRRLDSLEMDLNRFR